MARLNEAVVSLPGGCVIGTRPIDLHLKGLRGLGAQVEVEAGYVRVHAPRLEGQMVFLGGRVGPTVLGTANVMMAATLASGITVIESAACEPEVVDLADFLIAMGAKITGAGSPTITIHGVKALHGADHEVIADRRSRGLPITGRAPLGWRIIGVRARDSASKRSSREFTIDERERRLVEAIYEMRQAGSSIERIAIWLVTQRDYPNKRRLDNYKAVEWALAAKELGYPRETDSKRIVKEWRSGQRPKVGV